MIVLYKNSQFPLSAFFPQQPPPPPLLLLLPATNVDIDDVDTTDQTHHFFLDSPLTSLLTDYIKPTLHLENDVVVEFPDLKLQLHEVKQREYENRVRD